MSLLANRFIKCRQHRMRLMGLVFACTTILCAGCVKLDSGVSWAPTSIKDAPPRRSSIPPDPPPDLDLIIREQGNIAFSNLQAIQVTKPMPNGDHWKFCAKVSSLGITGKPIGGTYVVETERGAIRDRRQDTYGTCRNLHYRPVHL